jgi:EAL domain-containing protein (putative c-di-GMP-specific phosphodiesterase class I)/AraC-like DNA-binding protein
MTALIVDDDPFIQKLLTQQLRAIGVEDIAHAGDGVSALKQLARNHDASILLLCDLQMPGMDGVELLRALATAGFPGDIILMSGENAKILQTALRLAQAQKLTVLGALHKPIMMDELRALIHRRTAAKNPRHGIAIAAEKFTRDELEADIYAGKLICHFHPKVSLSTGQTDGVEALVRWQRSDTHLVYPEKFIPLAEKAGLIPALTAAVLRAALEEVKSWTAYPDNATISINVSVHNLEDLNFPETVSEALNDAGIAPERLILEITETQLLTERPAVMDVLTRLRLKRIGLSIDDFGKGSLSFVQLHDLPFSEIKIDCSFVHRAFTDAARRTIFDASVHVARRLGLKTVAEGVEDDLDWAFVREAGCTMAQGYFVARPMRGQDIPNWTAQWGQRYEATRNFVLVPKNYVDGRPVSADSALTSDIRGRRDLMLSDARGPVGVRVRLQQLLAASETGRLTADAVAQTLGVSRRSLVRRLAESGVSFHKMVEAELKNRARSMLDAAEMTQAEISERLGFADPTGFSRACRRWFDAPQHDVFQKTARD